MNDYSMAILKAMMAHALNSTMAAYPRLDLQDPMLRYDSSWRIGLMRRSWRPYTTLSSIGVFEDFDKVRVVIEFLRWVELYLQKEDKNR